MEEDIKLLTFIYERMANVHKEKPTYDYMIKFKELINKINYNKLQCNCSNPASPDYKPTF